MQGGRGPFFFDIPIAIHQNSAVSKAFLGRFKSQIIDINFEGLDLTLVAYKKNKCNQMCNKKKHSWFTEA